MDGFLSFTASLMFEELPAELGNMLIFVPCSKLKSRTGEESETCFSSRSLTFWVSAIVKSLRLPRNSEHVARQPARIFFASASSPFWM